MWEHATVRANVRGSASLGYVVLEQTLVRSRAGTNIRGLPERPFWSKSRGGGQPQGSRGNARLVKRGPLGTLAPVRHLANPSSGSWGFALGASHGGGARASPWDARRARRSPVECVHVTLALEMGRRR